MMTQVKWDAMTDQERYDHVSQGKKELKEIQGVEANAKVNEARVLTFYWIEVDGVTMSNRFLKEVDAFNEAEKLIEEMNPNAAAKVAQDAELEAEA